MSNTLGTSLKITTFGESHGPAIGVVIDGVKPGLPISREEIQRELDRRRPGQNKLVSPRNETDQVEILSGIFEGKTTGMPIALLIRNNDAQSKSYEAIKNLFRPGHADFTFFSKYGFRDYRGGGRQSARETANWVGAGAIAKKMLAKKGIQIIGYIKEIGGIAAKKIDYKEITRNLVNCPDKAAAKKIEGLIEKVRKEGDSLGGIVEVVAIGVPPGLGDPVLDKLSAGIGKAMLTINAVKGVEIGAGFQAARMKGSQNNDIFFKKGNKVFTRTNNAGGILGGISNGMPIVVRIAVKPASSITKEQETITVDGKKTTVRVFGRHDPCVAIRAVPVAEAMMAIVLADMMMGQEKFKR